MLVRQTQNVPVLATNLGVVPELFPDGGYLVLEIGDLDKMARKIERIVMSDETEQFIPQNVKDMLWKYDSKNMANRYYQHFMFEKLK